MDSDSVLEIIYRAILAYTIFMIFLYGYVFGKQIGRDECEC